MIQALFVMFVMKVLVFFAVTSSAIGRLCAAGANQAERADHRRTRLDHRCGRNICSS